MKAKLEFELPEEDRAFYETVNGPKAFSVLWDFDQWLRGEIKYNDKDFQEVRDTLNQIMNDRNISFDG